MEKKAVVEKQEDQLVFPRGRSGFTTSLIIAEKFKVRPANVIRKIERLVKKDKFNRLHFELVEYKDKKGEFRKMYEMDRDNFIILAMKFSTPHAIKWQIKFIQQFKFYEQQYFTKKHDIDYIEARQEGKFIRHDATGALKILIEYAIASGCSEGFIKNCYTNYTTMVNKALFVIPKGYKKIRESLEAFQLRRVAVAEELVGRLVVEEITLETNYKEIYYVCKDKLVALGEVVGKTNVPQFRIEVNTPKQLELSLN